MDYPPVKLSEKTAAKLRSISDKTRAVQMAVKMAQDNAERRLAELNEEGRAVWQEIADTYKLDVSHVNYVLNEKGDGLVATMVRLGD